MGRAGTVSRCILLLTLALGACDPGCRRAPADSARDGDSPPDDTGPPLVAWVVRHAEKDSEGSDPHLTDEGYARAEALAERLAEVPLSAVYATGYKRTQETCKPAAHAHDLPITIDIDPEDELAEHIIAEHQHEQVLHCGHSFSIPDLMEALGYEESVSPVEYGDLWIVTIQGDEIISAELEHFGE